jgi:hypothetical protein
MKEVIKRQNKNSPNGHKNTKQKTPKSTPSKATITSTKSPPNGTHKNTEHKK